MARAELVGSRSLRDDGRGDHATAADRRLSDDTTAAAHGRVGDDAIATADGRGRGDVVARPFVMHTRGGSTNDVGDHRRVIEMGMWTIHVIVVRPIEAERPADGDAVVPVPGRRHRRPADVAVTRRAHTPGDPRAGVPPAGDPRPAVVRQVDPAAVVERDPAPRVVGHPDVVRLLAVRPMPGGHVRLEVVADLLLRGHPHGAVDRIVDPRAVGLEHRPPLRERARIRVRVLVIVRADEDLAVLRGSLLARPLLGGELLGRRRLRRNVLVVGVVGLLQPSAPRGEETGDRRHHRRHRHPTRTLLDHVPSSVATGEPRETRGDVVISNASEPPLPLGADRRSTKWQTFRPRVPSRRPAARHGRVLRATTRV